MKYAHICFWIGYELWLLLISVVSLVEMVKTFSPFPTCQLYALEFLYTSCYVCAEFTFCMSTQVTMVSCEVENLSNHL